MWIKALIETSFTELSVIMKNSCSLVDTTYRERRLGIKLNPVLNPLKRLEECSLFCTAPSTWLLLLSSTCTRARSSRKFISFTYMGWCWSVFTFQSRNFGNIWTNMRIIFLQDILWKIAEWFTFIVSEYFTFKTACHPNQDNLVKPIIYHISCREGKYITVFNVCAT